MHDYYDANSHVLPAKRSKPLNNNIVDKGTFNMNQIESVFDGPLVRRQMFFSPQTTKKPKMKKKCEM